MGWSFAYDKRTDRKAVIKRFREPGGLLGPGYTLLQSSAVGSNFWYLYRCPDGRVSIGLCLMQRGGKDSGWGYKGMSEEMGPNEVNCPISYLGKASEPLGYAIEWRPMVRAHHAEKRARPKLAPGVVVEYAGIKFTLVVVDRRGARFGWRADAENGGGRYRLRAHQLARATVVSE